MHHYITSYEENGVLYSEAWLQINLFGRAICFWRKRIKNRARENTSSIGTIS